MTVNYLEELIAEIAARTRLPQTIKLSGGTLAQIARQNARELVLSRDSPRQCDTLFGCKMLIEHGLPDGTFIFSDSEEAEIKLRAIHVCYTYEETPLSTTLEGSAPIDPLCTLHRPGDLFYAPESQAASLVRRGLAELRAHP